MANLYNLKDYSKFVKVYDYENNKDITIELDETRTLKDNANKFYKLYNKGKTSVEKLTELTDNLRNSINYYEQILYSLEIASSVEDLFEITSEIETEKEKNLSKSLP